MNLRAKCNVHWALAKVNIRHLVNELIIQLSSSEDSKREHKKIETVFIQYKFSSAATRLIILFFFQKPGLASPNMHCSLSQGAMKHVKRLCLSLKVLVFPVRCRVKYFAPAEVIFYSPAFLFTLRLFTWVKSPYKLHELLIRNKIKDGCVVNTHRVS